MDALLATEAEDDFKKAVRLLGADDTLDEALNVLSGLYERTVDVQGDLGPGVAPVAQAYGRANLLLAVHSNQAFVNSEVKKKQREDAERAKAAAAAEEGGAAEDKEAAENEDEEEEEEEEEVQVLSRDDIEELFQVAFESLETSRVIYERLISNESSDASRKSIQKRLGDVFMRLGDLKLEQGLFADSVAEYRKCLEIRTITEESISRDLASVYHAIAMASETLAAEDVQNVQSVVDATVAYARTLEIFLNRAWSLIPQTTTDEVPTSGSKRKVSRPSKTWVEGLSSEQIALIDEAVSKLHLTSSLPAPLDEDGAEMKELRDLIGALANKVDDITYALTKEGREEEEKAAEERKRQAATDATETGFSSASTLCVPADGAMGEETTIGFGGAKPDERENERPAQEGMDGSTTSGAIPPKSPAKPVNVMLVRKKASTTTSAQPTSNPT